jgi:hypothetical protein
MYISIPQGADRSGPCGLQSLACGTAGSNAAGELGVVG